MGARAAFTTTTSTSPDVDTSPATDAGQSTDAHAIVVNHGDDRYRYALTLKIVHTFSDVVDPQNAAVAVAVNCTDCQTVAISLEGVLVYGDPSVFAPENIALAFNDNCTNCATLAAAYQEEVQTTGKVRITGAGRQAIADIRRDIEAIRHDDLTLPEIDQRVNADAAALLQVLRDDIVPIGNDDASPVGTVSASSTGPDSASAQPTTSPSESPTAGPTDTPSATPTDSSTSPTASPSSSPPASPSSSPS
jgi:cell division septation protein DedD